MVTELIPHNSPPTVRQQFERSGQVPIELRLTDIYWIYIAIRQVGIDGNKWSIQHASERLGVSRYRLSQWLQKGVRKATSGEAMNLSQLSGISINTLLDCCGRNAPARPTKRHFSTRAPRQQ